MENYELTAQQKFFQATGLKEGDRVASKFSGAHGSVYISAIGYACVLTTDGHRIIWCDDFVKV